MDPDVKWEGDGTVILQALIKTWYVLFINHFISGKSECTHSPAVCSIFQ